MSVLEKIRAEIQSNFEDSTKPNYIDAMMRNIGREECLEIIDKYAEQEPTDENLHREREQAYMQGYEDASKRFRQEPCDDVVSRQAVEEISRFDPLEPYNSDYVRGFIYGHDRLLNEIRKLTPVKPQEPKTGHWIGIDEEPHEDYECDKCGYVVSTYTANIEPHTEYKYCPKCGCRMVEPQESEERNETGN